MDVYNQVDKRSHHCWSEMDTNEYNRLKSSIAEDSVAKDEDQWAVAHADIPAILKSRLDRWLLFDSVTHIQTLNVSSVWWNRSKSNDHHFTYILHRLATMFAESDAIEIGKISRRRWEKIEPWSAVRSFLSIHSNDIWSDSFSLIIESVEVCHYVFSSFCACSIENYLKMNNPFLLIQPERERERKRTQLRWCSTPTCVDLCTSSPHTSMYTMCILLITPTFSNIFNIREREKG